MTRKTSLVVFFSAFSLNSAIEQLVLVDKNGRNENIYAT
jgi:hypothetical protein